MVSRLFALTGVEDSSERVAAMGYEPAQLHLP